MKRLLESGYTAILLCKLDMITLRSTQLTPQAVVHFVTQLAKAREVAEE